MTEPSPNRRHSEGSGQRESGDIAACDSCAPQWDPKGQNPESLGVSAGAASIGESVESTLPTPVADAPPLPMEVAVDASIGTTPEMQFSPTSFGSWHGRPRAPGWMFLMAARSLAVLIIVALFVLTFIVQPFSIPSESMEPTLLIGDFMLVNQAVFAPSGRLAWLLPHQPVRSGDVVVFRFPLSPHEYVVKRVIGVPGDRIHLEDGVVYRNGQPLREPYAVYLPSPPDPFRDDFPSGPYTDPNITPRWWAQLHNYESGGNLVVPPGEYFVMGDNRNRSLDSRYWGFVPRADIEGQPLVVYFSRRRISSANLPWVTRNDKLSREGVFGLITGFARWNRTLRIVR